MKYAMTILLCLAVHCANDEKGKIENIKLPPVLNEDLEITKQAVAMWTTIPMVVEPAVETKEGYYIQFGSHCHPDFVRAATRFAKGCMLAEAMNDSAFGATLRLFTKKTKTTGLILINDEAIQRYDIADRKLPIVAHEIGHMQGLQHTEGRNDIMNSDSLQFKEAKVPTEAELNTILVLYASGVFENTQTIYVLPRP